MIWLYVSQAYTGIYEILHTHIHTNTVSCESTNCYVFFFSCRGLQFTYHIKVELAHICCTSCQSTVQANTASLSILRIGFVMIIIISTHIKKGTKHIKNSLVLMFGCRAWHAQEPFSDAFFFLAGGLDGGVCMCV